MASLYGYKWTSKEGESDSDLLDSYNFKLWLDKTVHLTNDQWRRGVDRCENDLRHSARRGDDCWPPSYAEFIGFCDESKTGIYKMFPKELQESDEDKSKRKREAEKGIKRLNSIFDD